MSFWGAVFKHVAAVVVAVVAVVTGQPWLIKFAVALEISAVTELLTPKAKKQARQAQINTLTLGETPRCGLFGMEAATAGSLVDIGTMGGENGTDVEVLAIACADHRLRLLKGFWVNEDYFAFTADGIQGPNYPGLDIQVLYGTEDQEVREDFRAALGWDITDRMTGVSGVILGYRYSEDDGFTSRPTFLFVWEGKALYDPSKDSTVTGGSGAHRWDDPSTWEVTDNAYVVRYNYMRGIYACDRIDQPDQLILGRGLSALEAPPERAIFPASVCEEAVLGVGEDHVRRYSFNGVIFADTPYLEVEEDFAATMGGYIYQPDGGIEIMPGMAQTVVLEITDADLLTDQPISYSPFLTDRDKLNTVVTHYVCPQQKWTDITGPVKSDFDDVVADGQPFAKTYSLPFVTNANHAGRVGEIRRREGRLEKRAQIPLGPRFCALEEGDWIGWTSDRFLNGGRVVFRIEGYNRDRGRRGQYTLREISADCYDVPATDPEAGGHVPNDPPAAFELRDVTVAGVVIPGIDGARVAAARFTYAEPIDAGIDRIQAQVRRVDAPSDVASHMFPEDGDGLVFMTQGLGGTGDYEGRVRPLGVKGRRSVWSSWLPFTAADLDAPGPVTGPFRVKAKAGSDVVKWHANPAASDYKAQRIYRVEHDVTPTEDDYLDSAPAPRRRFVNSDPERAAGKSYDYYGKSEDTSGNLGAFTLLGTLSGISKPTGLVAVGTVDQLDDGTMASALAVAVDAPADATLTLVTDWRPAAGDYPGAEYALDFVAGIYQLDPGVEDPEEQWTRFADQVSAKVAAGRYPAFLGGEVIDTRSRWEDGEGSFSEWVVSTGIAIPIDATAPGPITSASVDLHRGVPRVKWTNPADADFARTNWRRGTTSVFADATPIKTPGGAEKFDDVDAPADAPVWYFGTTEDRTGNEDLAAYVTVGPVTPGAIVDAEIDQTRPANAALAPALSRVLTFDSATGRPVLRLRVVLTNEVGEAGYVVALKRGSDDFAPTLIDAMTTSTTAYFDVAVGDACQVKHKLINALGRRSSAYGSVASLTIAGDTTAPGLIDVSGLVRRPMPDNTIVLKDWVYPSGPTDSDLAGVVIKRSLTNTLGSAVIVDYVRWPATKWRDESPLTTGAPYYYWLAAFDTSGNVGTYTSVGSGTSPRVIEGSDVNAGAIDLDYNTTGNLTSGQPMLLASGAAAPVALQPQLYFMSDGETVTFPYDYGTVPQYVILSGGLPTPAAGDSYSLNLDVSSTQAVATFKRVTPGSITAKSTSLSSAVDTTFPSHLGSTSGMSIAKTDTSVAFNGRYKMQAHFAWAAGNQEAVATFRLYYIDGGSWTAISDFVVSVDDNTARTDKAINIFFNTFAALSGSAKFGIRPFSAPGGPIQLKSSGAISAVTWKQRTDTVLAAVTDDVAVIVFPNNAA